MARKKSIKIETNNDSVKLSTTAQVVEEKQFVVEKSIPTAAQTQSKFQVLGKTKTVKGSILNPETGGLRFILSLNNLSGNPEGNPLLSIFDKKWRKVREESRGWWSTRTGAYKFGAVKDVSVQSDVWVMGMLCQNEKFEVDLPGLKLCLKNVLKIAKNEKASVHVSSLLTDLIPELSNLCKSELIDQGISVYFYDEPVK